ncbi:hypothetical protein [Christiangramia salexigens]|uniref:Uncharacterized protein n=1 Tax=Christiangramia salexigens TaxID=1913577 RepID=A0A1L3J697_9FLAO|nr:hypothetical protein [Christiangramia salexigens]APG60642.1 hypothetical protein LPB144_09610 [Christiangramia salexigens]
MKLNMIAVSITVLLSVLIPYLLLLYYGKYDSRKLKKTFKLEARINALTFSKKEHWDLNYLGLDSIQEKLLFIQMIDKKPIVKLLDFKNLKSVDLETIEMKTPGKHSRVFLEEVNIHFKYRNEPDLMIQLFNRSRDYFESNEVQRAQSWVNEFKILLNNTAKIKKAA